MAVFQTPDINWSRVPLAVILKYQLLIF